LTNHAPLITAIVPGRVTIKDKSGEEITMAASYGFFEISSNKATLLVDSIEFGSDIDLKRAREALERARRRLIDEAGSIDGPRAKKAIARAASRIRIASPEEE
jgi:F-type H+-transporting ATPase subunit epsilon